MSAIPMHWVGEIPASDKLFLVSKERAKEPNIIYLAKSNRQVMHTKKQIESVPVKQQQKWCDALQTLPNDIDWIKI